MNKYQFNSANELISLTKSLNTDINDIVIKYSAMSESKPESYFIKEMKTRFTVMKESINLGLENSTRSKSGLSGGDAQRIDSIDTSKSMTGKVLLNAIKYAFAIQEHNARFGRVVAFPTAGSAGTVPGVLVSIQEELGLSDDIVTRSMFTAAAIGMITGENAMLAGAVGGCQAEIGTACAMAAGAAVNLRGGTATQSFHAAAIALKGLLGLVCDPIAGLVEAPCVKRNSTAVANAFMASEIALGGVESNVPYDEVVVAMKNIASRMSCDFKETARGGLAITKTGERIKKELGYTRPVCGSCHVCG